MSVRYGIEASFLSFGIDRNMPDMAVVSRVLGLGFRAAVQDLGLGVDGELRVEGLRLRIQGLGLRV